MTSVFPITFFVVCVVYRTVFTLPCLTNKSKQDFHKARNALKSLENFLKSQASSINSKVQALDKDMTSMEEDFKQTNNWLESTDVVNGDWRWIYDQTQLSYKNFYSGRPLPTSNSNSYTYNCIMMHYSNGNWYDIPCNNSYPYVCESNFCKFYKAGYDYQALVSKRSNL
ncbi:NCAN [Mytilus coruscus]|uniref:NCAN n=1 Tax=Mytilus coruscus TaxID=42192 RepID=A0A6J8A4E9_MYTCO|nr:NCAN [Mytilus coruscus]